MSPAPDSAETSKEALGFTILLFTIWLFEYLPRGRRIAIAPAMTPQELRERTMVFALAVFKFTRPMMDTRASGHVATQLFRAATAVAANYRAACLGRSRAEFIAKLGVVREEADEVVFWVEFAQRSGLSSGPAIAAVAAEALELAAIIAASYRTVRERTSAQNVRK